MPTNPSSHLRPLRAVLYCRLSRADLMEPGKTEEKFERYVAMGKAQAARHALPLADADIYIEQVSGAKLANRPMMLAILEQAERGEFTHLLAAEWERLLRGDKRDEQDVEDALCAGGVTVILGNEVSSEVLRFDGDNYDALPIEFRSLAARMERRKYSERVRRANHARQIAGKRCGGFAAYGYLYVPDARDPFTRAVTLPAHHALRAELEIADPAAAYRYARASDVPNLSRDCLTPDGALDSAAYLAYARRVGLPGGALLPGVVCTGGEYHTLCEIFERYKTQGLLALCRELNTRLVATGSPAPPGTARRQNAAARWQVGSLLRILSNPFFAGFPAHRWTTNRSGHHVALSSERCVWAKEEGTYPHPVTYVQWERLQQLAGERVRVGSPKPLSANILSGLLFCCEGVPMRGGNGQSYRCRCVSNGNEHPGMGVLREPIEREMVRLLGEAIAALPVRRSASTTATKATGRESGALSEAFRDVTTKREAVRSLEPMASLFERSGQGEAFAASLETARAELRAAEARYAAAKAQLAGQEAEASLQSLREIRALGFETFWQAATTHERRELLRGVFQRVTLSRPPALRVRNRAFVVTVQPWIAPFYDPGEVAFTTRRVGDNR